MTGFSDITMTLEAKNHFTNKMSAFFSECLWLVDTALSSYLVTLTVSEMIRLTTIHYDNILYIILSLNFSLLRFTPSIYAHDFISLTSM